MYQSEKDAEQLDAYFSALYDSEISPEGEEDIQNFIGTLSPSLNETERFEKIAGWVTANFTDYYWERSYLNNSEFDFVPILPNYKGYESDPRGGVRANPPSTYANDPAWIAYYRTGACGELASLFADVVDRTGNPTKIVVAKFTEDRNHAWVEITRDNGEIICFDPTIYGEYFIFGKRESGVWTAERSSFKLLWRVEIEGVYDVDTNEDVMEHYPILVQEKEERICRCMEKQKRLIFTNFENIQTSISEGISI